MREVDGSADPISRFASGLFDTPALRPLSALQKETQALNLLHMNGPQLIPVFTSLGMDVSRGWREPAALVSEAIKAAADEELASEISEAVSSRLAFSFFRSIAGGREAPANAREELRALLGRAAAHSIARRALAGSLAVFRADIIEKYIPRAYKRKKYIYVETTRVQRLTLAPAELADLLKFIVLVRPAAYLYMTTGETIDKDAGYSPLQEQMLLKVESTLASRVPSIPGALLRLGLRSALAFPGGGNVEATSRLGAIMAMRGRTLVPSQVVDHGADTPDKSWFNVQKRNARWHGLDGQMLEELYTIAAENGW